MGRLERRREREAAISASYVRSILAYDADTGQLKWLERRSLRIYAGAIAGSRNKAGYLAVTIRGQKFMAHRLAWLIATGQWPDFDVDHVNGDCSDNRLSNLRQATRSQNCANRSNAGIGKSGAKGVWWHAANRKWIAAVGKKYIGSFDTVEEARSAYHRAAQRLYSEYARPQ